MAQIKEEAGQIERLGSRLDRNMKHILGLVLRGIDTGDSGIRLGTAESGHRYYKVAE